MRKLTNKELTAIAEEASQLFFEQCTDLNTKMAHVELFRLSVKATLIKWQEGHWRSRFNAPRVPRSDAAKGGA